MKARSEEDKTGVDWHLSSELSGIFCGSFEGAVDERKEKFAGEAAMVGN